MKNVGSSRSVSFIPFNFVGSMMICQVDTLKMKSIYYCTNVFFNLTGLSGSMMYVPDSHLVQDEEDDGTPGRYNHSEDRRSQRASQTRRESQGESDTFFQKRPQNSHVLINTTKVCTQELPLPDGVEVRIYFSATKDEREREKIVSHCHVP